MSVTFAAEYAASDIAGWVVTHAGIEDRFSVVFDGRDDAVRALVEHDDTCDRELCEMYGGQVDAVPTIPDLSLNMSNVNARFLLDSLGLGDAENLIGECPADDFLGRVLLAEAIAPVDEGVPSHSTPGRGAVMVNCGRRPGYLADRLTGLRELAEWCRSHSRAITWG